MDGTLLDNGSLIPEKNRQALAELKRRGVGIVLATGRTALMTRKFVQELDIELPVIANNGSLVVDMATREVLYQKTFSLPVLYRLIDYCVTNDKDYFIYTIDKVYYSPRSKKIQIMNFYNSCVTAEEKINIIRLPETIKEVFSMLPDGGDQCAFKILVSYFEPGDYDYFRTQTDVEAIMSQADAFDVMPAGSTKGNALEFLTSLLGIDPQHVFAFGDNHNDLSMLAYAGFALVPCNGVEEARLLADFVTESNDDAGIAQGVYEFVIPKIASFSEEPALVSR
jgi:Cof subfamily protein (haloacid dehalogenase superfamily)